MHFYHYAFCLFHEVQITIGESRSLNSQKKRKQPKKWFTWEQLIWLEKAFAENHYLTTESYLYLSTKLSMSTCQIQCWFRNRRAKERKAVKKLIREYIKYTVL